MPLLSQPLLPVEFVQRVMAHPMMSRVHSRVYSKPEHDARLRMRDWLQPMLPDTFVFFRDSLNGFAKEARRTFLHLASFEGDVLLLSEYLRCGATADKTDSTGVSPLYLALSRMETMKASQRLIVQRRTVEDGPLHNDGTPWKVIDYQHAIYRYAWIARILVEQHVDVNREVDGISVLQLACQSANWETISLLLEHGAIPYDHLTTIFASSADRQRLADLILTNCHPHPRPPRVCPCWSGKIVSECHGKIPQPYPDHFICVCGSGKTYGRCCSRKTPVVEKWDGNLQQIVPGFDHDSDKKFPEPMRQIDQKFRYILEQTAELRDLLGVPAVDLPVGVRGVQQHCQDEEYRTMMSEMISTYLAKGLVDPAFAYPASLCKFFPRPCGRTRSRNICERMKIHWNALVDEYIVECNDPRSRFEIEKAAKIGTWHGALIRTCEGDGCERSETKEESFKLCSKCKIAVYCSVECQKSAWKSHKAECGSDSQYEQALPSQKTLDRLILQDQEDFVKELYASSPPPALIPYIVQYLKQQS